VSTKPASLLHHELSGTGAPLVVIHGVGSQADDWSRVLPYLTGDFAVLRFDLRGHGRSSAPPGPYHIDDFVDDLVALMDKVGFARAHIAGFSLGGLVAQAFALRCPERVDRLVLISTVAGRTQAERERVVGRLEFIANSHPADYFEQSVERWFTPAFREANPEIIANRKATVTAMEQQAYASAYHALAHTDLGDKLAEICADTLVITGADDLGSNPRMARFMATTIPGARLQILDGLRHSILLEAPQTVGPMLRQFLLAGET
jgi:(E)-2-((N-methylformamido)methylene)succinate hydrolase